MIELGKVQTLKVLRIKSFGVYVGEETDSEESVLLPKKQVPEGTKIGDELSVFRRPSDRYDRRPQAAGRGSRSPGS